MVWLCFTLFYYYSFTENIPCFNSCSANRAEKGCSQTACRQPEQLPARSPMSASALCLRTTASIVGESVFPLYGDHSISTAFFGWSLASGFKPGDGQFNKTEHNLETEVRRVFNQPETFACR